MKNNEQNFLGGYNQELQKRYIKSRKKSDEELIAGGASVISTGKQIILNPNERQRERIQNEHERRREIIEQKIEKAQIDTINKYTQFANEQVIIDQGHSKEQRDDILRQKLLYHFKKRGLVIEIGGIDVYDIKSFKDGVKFAHAILNAKYKENIGGQTVIHYFSKGEITSLLRDIAVVSIDDYKKQRLNEVSPEEISSKPLFNIPHITEDITNIDNIKNKEYYLEYWDIYTLQRINKQTKFSIENGDEINLMELYIAVKIFRDLGGHRNEKGELVVFNSQKQKFEKMTTDLMRKLKIFKTYNLGVQQTLSKYCPHLLESGLLRRDDFIEYTNQDKNNSVLLRIERVPNFPNRFKPGFDSTTYYLGRKYFIFDNQKILMKNIKAVDLDPNYVGIVRLAEGREELIYRILKVKENEKKELIKRGASKIKYGKVIELGKKLVEEQIEKYQIADTIPRKVNESAEEYAERLSRLANYKEVSAVTKELSTKTGVGIHNLSWREQLQIAQMSFESNFNNQKENFIDFIKTYGLVGLRAFLSLEQGGTEMGEKILAIGERFKEDNEVAQNIFAKYAELVDMVYGVEKYLQDEFGQENQALTQKIQEDLLLSGKAILVLFANEEMIVEEAKKRLEEINIQTVRVIKVIQSLSPEDIANLNLIKTNDIKLESIDSQKVLQEENKELLQQMCNLVKSKFPNKNAGELFKEELKTKNTTDVIVSKLDKEVLSFFTRKKTGDNTYEIDWVTSNDKAVIKGLAEATIISGFEELQQEDEKYYAVAKPYVKTFRILIEKMGFVSDGGITADEEYKHHYAKTRRLPEDSNYFTKNFSPEQNEEFIKLLTKTIQTPNKLQAVEFNSKQYRVAKIIFENTDYKKDIKEGDRDGLIYQLIKKQHQQGRVLTRFIPESSQQNNKTFFAVFE